VGETLVNCQLEDQDLGSKNIADVDLR